MSWVEGSCTLQEAGWVNTVHTYGHATVPSSSSFKLAEETSVRQSTWHFLSRHAKWQIFPVALHRQVDCRSGGWLLPYLISVERLAMASWWIRRDTERVEAERMWDWSGHASDSNRCVVAGQRKNRTASLDTQVSLCDVMCMLCAACCCYTLTEISATSAHSQDRERERGA